VIAQPLVIAGGAVVTPSAVIDPGQVVVDSHGRIVAVGVVAADDAPGDAMVIDATGCWVTPGFIDVQINGGHGIDLTTEPGRAGELGRFLPRYGVTAFVPTIITCRDEQRAAALDWWTGREDANAAAEAVPVGLHIEGPMLAATRRGAHPLDLLRQPDIALIDGWSRASGVLIATLAPELPDALELIGELTERGVVVSIGHTDCTAAQFAAGVAAGARYVTHLFNGMRPFSHREPGPIGATLAGDSVVAGLICDGIHVDPIAVRMAWRALQPDRVNLVTDAVAVLGSGPGDSKLGSVEVTVDGGGVRTAEGVLAGSDLSLDRAVRNLVAFTGCSVPDAVRTVTATPARLLELTDRGALVPGVRADVTVLSAELDVVTTVVGGEVAWRS
jgi:N-acetylglucosamine-6-phosphate deacetylase